MKSSQREGFIIWIRTHFVLLNSFYYKNRTWRENIGLKKLVEVSIFLLISTSSLLFTYRPFKRKVTGTGPLSRPVGHPYDDKLRTGKRFHRDTMKKSRRRRQECSGPIEWTSRRCIRLHRKLSV